MVDQINYQSYIILQMVIGTGYAAISKLADAPKVSEDEAKQWLEKQAIWQIYLPAPKYIPRPHWRVNKPNKIHQADLLFLPHDT